MLHGISRSKQVITFCNHCSNHCQVCIFYLYTRQWYNSHAKCLVHFSTRFTSLFAVRTSTVASASKTVTMMTSTHNLPLSSLRWKVLNFLLSRIDKPNHYFLHLQIFSLICPLSKTGNCFYPIHVQRLWISWIRSITKMLVIL